MQAIKMGCSVCGAEFEDPRQHDAKTCAQVQVHKARVEIRLELEALRAQIANLKAFVGAP